MPAKSLPATRRRIAAWQARFLESLRETPNVSVACKSAGRSRMQAYRARGEDPQFAADWKATLDASVDELEARAFQIALEGRDSNLLQFLLRAHRPETYQREPRRESAEGQRELAAQATVTHIHITNLPWRKGDAALTYEVVDVVDPR